MTVSDINNIELNRVAVITGGNRGIGYYIALQIGMSGKYQHIVLACRNTQQADVNDAVKSIQAQVPSHVTISSNQLIIGNIESHIKFVNEMKQRFGKIDCLVNNAGVYKENEPILKQVKETLNTNFYGPVDLIERMIDLLKLGNDPRIVNVASQLGRLSQVDSPLQTQFATGTVQEIKELVKQFEQCHNDGTLTKYRWNSKPSSYGISKLALIAATKSLAREYHSTIISINSCCPGYCKTDMTRQMGTRPPEDGSQNAVISAIMANPPSGEFYSNYKISTW